MPTAKTFLSFPSLPPELRIMVWELAFAVPNGVEVVARHDNEPHPARLTPTVRWSLTFTDAVAPLQIALSCKEAMAQLPKSCTKVVPKSHPQAIPSGSYWMNLERTVFYIPAEVEAKVVLTCLDDDDLDQIEHIAFGWRQSSIMSGVIQNIKYRCSNLKAIFIQRSPKCEDGASPRLDLRQCFKVMDGGQIKLAPIHLSFDVMLVSWLVSALYKRGPPLKLHLVEMHAKSADQKEKNEEDVDLNFDATFVPSSK